MRIFLLFFLFFYIYFFSFCYIFEFILDNFEKKEFFYLLDMFPYTSGFGLHLGHARTYISSDIYHRFLQLNNYVVFRPIGWDTFGLPAEQFSKKYGEDPHEF